MDKVEITQNELSHYKSLIKQDAENKALIKELQSKNRELEQVSKLPIHGVSKCPLCNSDNTTVESDGIWCNGCDEWTSTKV
tara:strand:+ start:347 stop:589 length:243 start_codon:yes stop_codon:yes gene_type:complete